MLILADQRTQCARTIKGEAHIVITINGAGQLRMEGIFHGRQDCVYAAAPDDRLLQRELPRLLAELRAQLSAAGSQERSRPAYTGPDRRDPTRVSPYANTDIDRRASAPTSNGREAA